MNTIGFTFGPLITACTLGSPSCRCLSSGGDHIYSDSKKHLLSHMQSTVQGRAQPKGHRIKKSSTRYRQKDIWDDSKYNVPSMKK